MDINANKVCSFQLKDLLNEYQQYDYMGQIPLQLITRFQTLSVSVIEKLFDEGVYKNLKKINKNHVELYANENFIKEIAYNKECSKNIMIVNKLFILSHYCSSTVIKGGIGFGLAVIFDQLAEQYKDAAEKVNEEKEILIRKKEEVLIRNETAVCEESEISEGESDESKYESISMIDKFHLAALKLAVKNAKMGLENAKNKLKGFILFLVDEHYDKLAEAKNCSLEFSSDSSESESKDDEPIDDPNMGTNFYGLYASYLDFYENDKEGKLKIPSDQKNQIKLFFNPLIN